MINLDVSSPLIKFIRCFTKEEDLHLLRSWIEMTCQDDFAFEINDTNLDAFDVFRNGFERVLDILMGDYEPRPFLGLVFFRRTRLELFMNHIPVFLTGF